MLDSRPYVLSIAAHDPSGGAGIIADCKTFEYFKTTGLAVATGITFQNEARFIGVQWLSFEVILKQLQPLLDVYPVQIVKIGMIENVSILNQLIDWLLLQNQNFQFIWDPVMAASSGFVIHDSVDEQTLLQLLGKLFLLTPNQPEMVKLSKSNAIHEAAKVYAQFTNVLLKGGHGSDQLATDILYIKNGNQLAFSLPRIENTDKHGTGCMLSSAIAAQLANGIELTMAIHNAKAFVHQQLLSNSSQLAWYTF